MTKEVFRQALIILRKNITLANRDYEFFKALILPIITFIFIIIGKQNQKYESLSFLGLYFLPLTMVTVTRFITYQLVEEKTTKQKEIQKIMGVKHNSYVLGWFFTNVIKVTLVIVIFLLLTVPTKAFEINQVNSISNMHLIVGFTLFGFAQMALAYFLSVFFTVPKLAADISGLVSVVGDVMINLFFMNYVQDNPWVVYIMSIFPSTCFTRIVFTSLTGVYLKYDNNQAVLMLILDTIVYFLLYLYFDRIIPNEYGTHKSPCFCFKFLKKRSQVTQELSQFQPQQQSLSIPLSGNQQNNFYDYREDFSSAIYHQTISSSDYEKSIEITDLKKSFGETQAVNGVSLSIYESQLLCLLGHNGAGKTTLISLITGLIDKNQGIVKIYGKSIDEELDDIRQMTGICVQRDVLYDQFTVQEHLTYYAQMKGFEGLSLQQELNETMAKCMLEGEKMKYAKELSGGNKRKLSLAMALIGKSKIIFLDEPTSGLDPVTRRSVWTILQDLKKEKRTLILTTHHLDEAEVLSERIAIMAKGKLLTVGSAEFIKRNFGIGYHLSIYKNRRFDSLNQQAWEDKKQKLKSFILGNLNGSRLNPQTADDTVMFTLPYSEKSKLLFIFKELEKDECIQIDLAMNSLEEAFINIGMDEESFISKTKKFSVQNNNIQDNNDLNQMVEFTDFSSIPIPSCLHNQPQYYFMNQLKACFKKRVITQGCGKALVLQLIMPIYFAFITAVACYLLPGQNKSTAAILITIEMSLGMCLASSNTIGQIVEEREKKLKYTLNVMGCRVFPYWIGNVIYDTLIQFIVIGFLILFLLSFGQRYIITIGTILILLSSQFSVVSMSYILTWMFSRSSLAYKTSFLLLYGIFLLFPLFLLLIIQKSSVFQVLTFLSPFFGMVSGLLVQSPGEQWLWFHNYLAYLIILIVQGLTGIIIYRQIRQFQLMAHVLEYSLNYIVIQSGEEDVLNEANRISRLECRDSVKCMRIAKQYNNGFLAVKGTSFGVDEGTVFGLLGPNGAGKSTTFNMITSKLKPSSGNIYLKNQPAEKSNFELYQHVGVCPQFDCLWDQMNPIQHLKLIAELKGLKDHEVNESVHYFLRIMQLDLYAKTQASKLSGGNKRKLCVAMSCIGSPSLQFFDEPSSGVDPIARRFLWNTIQQGLKLNKSAVVLTTHSLDEAENICHKIAIQINGQFVCFGSPQHLKTKYGSGYRITVDCKETNYNICQAIRSEFPSCVQLQEKDPKRLSFQFPAENFSFYKVFKYFQDELQGNQKVINDFQVVQSTLEQVFIHFATFQDNRDGIMFQPNRPGFCGFCNGDEEQ